MRKILLVKYIVYKTITSQSILSEVQGKNSIYFIGESYSILEIFNFLRF